MKRVFLTGGTGFLGRSILNELLHRGYFVHLLIRSKEIPEFVKKGNVEIVQGDLWDLSWLDDTIQKVDFVVHAAATFSGSWDDFYQVNVAATEALYSKAIEKELQKFVYISSVSVYPHSQLKNFSCSFREEDPYEDPEKASLYARSKIEAEKKIISLGNPSGTPYVIFRPGAIYGPAGPIFPATLGIQIGSKRILLIGSPKHKLPLSYVENVAKAVAFALESDSVNGQIFNLVEDQTLSRKQYVQFLKEKVDPDISYVRVPRLVLGSLKTSARFVFSFLGKSAPMANLNLDLYTRTISYSNKKWRQYSKGIREVDFPTSLERTANWFKRRSISRRLSRLKGFSVVLPKERKFRIGVIGCGNVAHYHLLFLRRSGVVDRLYVADVNEKALEIAAERFNADGSFHDYRELLEKTRPDVVHILVPPQFHKDAFLAAVDYGAHVLVEKPMAISSAEAEQMVRAAEKSGIRFSVMHNHLFDRVMLEAQRFLNNGGLGSIVFVESWYGVSYGTASPPFPPNYWGYTLPGGLFQDYLPHALYTALEFMPNPTVKEVFVTSRGRIPLVKYDELHVTLQEEQRLANVHVSMAVSPRYQFLNVYGTQGAMTIDLLNKVIFVEKEFGPLPKSVNRILFSIKRSKRYAFASLKSLFGLPKTTERIFEGTERFIQIFYRSIARDEEMPVTAEEALQLMKLMDEVWDKLPSS